MKIKLFLSPKVASASLDRNVFCFVTDRVLTKKEISFFIETHYSTEVDTINTTIRKGKQKKKGRFLYKRKAKKIAYVTLKKGANTSDLTQEIAQSFMQKYGMGGSLNKSYDTYSDDEQSMQSEISTHDSNVQNDNLENDDEKGVISHE